MPKICFWMAVLLVSGSQAASAGQFSFAGAFTYDDDVRLFSFTLSSGATVVLRTWSYGGGTNLAGNTIPAGGFDPTLTLFDGLGNWVASASDGPAAFMNPDNGNYLDAYLSMDLLPGLYTLALTQGDNGPAGGTLADGFIYTNSAAHDFTASYCATGSGATGFCDAYGDQRTSAWAVDLDNVDAAVPEPATLIPVAGAVLYFLRRRLPRRRI